jgi:hypothetical protein
LCRLRHVLWPSTAAADVQQTERKNEANRTNPTAALLWQFENGAIFTILLLSASVGYLIGHGESVGRNKEKKLQ